MNPDFGQQSARGKTTSERRVDDKGEEQSLPQTISRLLVTGFAPCEASERLCDG